MTDDDNESEFEIAVSASAGFSWQYYALKQLFLTKYYIFCKFQTIKYQKMVKNIKKTSSDVLFCRHNPNIFSLPSQRRKETSKLEAGITEFCQNSWIKSWWLDENLLMANFYFESQGGSLQPHVFRAPRPSEIHYHTSLDSCLSNRKDKQPLNTNRLQIITNQRFAHTKLPTNPFITITPVYLNQPETCFSSSRTTQDIHTHTHPGLHTRTTWRPPSLTARQQVCCRGGGVEGRTCPRRQKHGPLHAWRSTCSDSVCF